MSKKKYNNIMPDTTDACLCIEIEREISHEGYNENFLKRIEKMVNTYNQIRLLVYYKNFSGWDKEAAMMDISTSNRFQGKLYKMAMVSAPDSEITRGLVRQESLKGKIRLFEESELQAALKWVKE